MGKCLKFCVLLLGSTLIFGCASQNKGALTAQRSSADTQRLATGMLKENDPAMSGKLVKKAKSAIGTPYVLGGSQPGGFDCSGLVKWAYNSVGVELPRTAREQSVVGKKVKDVEDMRAGDIVAFRHPKRGYHTGIYVGNGKFVHSPRKRSHVRINSLSDPYFSKTLLGARRISLDGSENLVAQAESRLRDYVAKKSQLSLSKRNLEKIKAAGKQVAKSSKNKSARKTVAGKTRKSVIAHNASKIKSIKHVTGKTKINAKNGKAHAKLANASKKTSHKAVAELRNKKSSNKTVSMLNVKKTKAVSRATHRKRS